MKFVGTAAMIAITAGIVAAQLGAPDPWAPADLMSPESLAAALKKPGSVLVILYVGFPVLYRSAHVPGAILAGPASKPEGLEALKAALANVKRDQPIVLYCGCCPWNVCPNVRPAFKLVREMGFKSARLVTIPENMHTDWISKGYPVERAPGQAPKP